MGRYVDGFVLAVPKAKHAEYLKMARLGKKVWLDHGALEYCESVADDVQPGKHTSFPQAVKLKADEEVWFAFAVYKSRRHRDQVIKKVMADPRMAAYGPKNMPFDGKRMIFGGFKAVVSG